MARSRSRSRRRSKYVSSRNQGTRVASVNTSALALRSRSSSTRSLQRLSSIEDRRRFHPLGKTAPARSFSRPRHRLKVARHAVTPALVPARPGPSRSAPLYSPPGRIAFDAPQRVLVCVRRNVRKEVMHATGYAGKSGQRSPRYSEYSSIDC